MARNVGLLLLFACGSCMEMRETVERMVVLRTTGSDLQPAATGFIYKKESDGPASVTKMGESEVMEHLSKMYEKPKSFVAPIPVAAGPFYGKEDENNAASFSSESKVIPVIENQDDSVDGIADEDFGKMLNYASDYPNYKSNFDESLKTLGHFEDGLYHSGETDYEKKKHEENKDKEQEEYGKKHEYENGGAGNYHSENYKSYHMSKEGDNKNHDDADSFGKHYALGHGHGDDGYKSDLNKEDVGRFHNLFDKNEYKKDLDFYDDETLKGWSPIHKLVDGYSYYGSNAKGLEGDSLYTGHDATNFGKGFYDKAEDEYGNKHAANKGESSHFYGDFGSADGKSFGYEIKH